MAFFSKLGNILRQTACKQLNSEICASKPSVFQAIRCMSSMSSSKLFIGGLSFGTDEQSLREAFSKYGEIIDARIIVDRDTGRSRGFGFVTFTSSEEASSAIQALDGQDLHGRQVRVNYATDRARPSFGGGGYGNSGYGSGGGGYGGGGYGSGGGYQGSGGGDYGRGGGGYNSNYSGGASGGGYGASSAGYNNPGGNTYDNVGSGGYGSTNANFDVAAGSGGSDNYVDAGSSSNFASGGYDGSVGQGFGGGNQDAAGGFNQDTPSEGNYRDNDDESGDFAKRA